MTWSIYSGDCVDGLRELGDNSAHSCVCDPPYGLSTPPDPADVLAAWTAGTQFKHDRRGFMGKEWDSFVPGPEMWREAYRVLRPGAHLVAFSGTRTVDWMLLSLRLAGFEIRDVGQWCYWNGFPKSMDVGKAIDRELGASREVVGSKIGRPGYHLSGHDGRGILGDGIGSSTADTRRRAEEITAPGAPESAAWDGWGTALKPAVEPWILARKPLDGTVANNFLRWGVGGINVDGCRYPDGDTKWPGPQTGAAGTHCNNRDSEGRCRGHGNGGRSTSGQTFHAMPSDGPEDRWPANLVHVRKPSAREREAGCEHIPPVSGAEAVARTEGSAGMDNPRAGAGRTAGAVHNNHPTLKPIALMAWLVRLVTPPGGLVIDPFAGSGTCGAAAAAQGFRYWGAEIDPTGRFQEIARARIGWWEANGLDALSKPAPKQKSVNASADQVSLFGSP